MERESAFVAFARPHALFALLYGPSPSPRIRVGEDGSAGKSRTSKTAIRGTRFTGGVGRGVLKQSPLQPRQ